MAPKTPNSHSDTPPYNYPRLVDLIKINAPTGLVYRDSRIPHSEDLYFLADYNPRTHQLSFIDFRKISRGEGYEVVGVASQTKVQGRDHYQLTDLVWIQDRDLPVPVLKLVEKLRKKIHAQTLPKRKPTANTVEGFFLSMLRTHKQVEAAGSCRRDLESQAARGEDQADLD